MLVCIQPCMVLARVHRDPAVELCIKRLHRALDSERSTLNIETLSLAAIGINAAEGNANPFQVLV